MLADFPVTVDSTQILVYTESRAAPGLLWTDDHVAQGFAWSDGIVSFGVPDHDGASRLEVDLARSGALDPQALWAVQVPFHVTEPLRIGTAFETHRVALPIGRYNLTYQAFPGTDDVAYVLRLSFSHSDSPEFRIVKRGGDIVTDSVLRRDAEPAT